MNKVIIPRRDHEVYFISLPNEIKGRQIKACVTAQLDKLHPGFSSALQVDLQNFSFDKKR